VLQQDAFDEIDAVTSLERQQTILSMVTDICRSEFDFEDFEEVTDFFKKIINLCKQMNYSEFNSANYNNYLAQLQDLLATKKIA
jgi:V/A-type H+-transporting ATPase subunit A